MQLQTEYNAQSWKHRETMEKKKPCQQNEQMQARLSQAALMQTHHPPC
jgi:hypothetical protein